MFIFDFYSTFYVKLSVLVLRITAEKLKKQYHDLYVLSFMNECIYLRGYLLSYTKIKSIKLVLKFHKTLKIEICEVFIYICR